VRRSWFGASVSADSAVAKPRPQANGGDRRPAPYDRRGDEEANAGPVQARPLAEDEGYERARDGVGRPTALPTRGVESREHKRRQCHRHEGEHEPDPVQHRVRTERCRQAVGGAGREAERGLRRTEPGEDKTRAVGGEQNRSPGAGSAWVERTADADGERDDEEAGGDEVRDLNPAGLPKREQARGVMVGQVGIE
jgi:hypothetical protein